MIVIIRRYGQICNRIFQFAHFFAYCKEYKIKLLNPTFKDLNIYFGPQNEDIGRAYILPLLSALPRILLCVLRGRIMNINSDEKNNQAKEVFKQKDYLVWGWGFRDHQNFLKHKDEIRQYFAINEELVRETSAEFDRKRRDFDSIIGVHIRRGDYKTWADGRYFYNDETYISFIQQLSNLLFQQKILFVVCSNADLDQSKYETIETDNLKFWFPKKDSINELNLLSKCDRIIGPPSTYSHWASFYGDVPCLHVLSGEQNISLSDFKVCNG